MGLLGFFKGKDKDQQQQPEGNAQDESQVQDQPEPAVEQPDMTDLQNPEDVSEATPSPNKYEQQAQDVISLLANLSDEESEPPVAEPQPTVEPVQAEPESVIPQKGETVTIPAGSVLAALPDEVLADTVEALNATYADNPDYGFVFKKRDVMNGMGVGRIDVAMAALAGSIPLPVFNDGATVIRNTVTLPLQIVFPHIPPEWLQKKNQDTSKEKLVQEMDDLFDLDELQAAAATPADDAAPKVAPEPEVAPAPEPDVAPVPEPDVAPVPEPDVAPVPEPDVAPAPEPASSSAEESSDSVDRNPYKQREPVVISDGQVLVDPIIALEPIPDDALLLPKGEILDQVGAELNFSLKKDEVIEGLKKGALEFPMRDYFRRFNFALFSEEASARSEMLAIPLEKIRPSLPSDWLVGIPEEEPDPLSDILAASSSGTDALEETPESKTEESASDLLSAVEPAVEPEPVAEPSAPEPVSEPKPSESESSILSVDQTDSEEILEPGSVESESDIFAAADMTPIPPSAESESDILSSAGAELAPEPETVVETPEPEPTPEPETVVEAPEPEPVPEPETVVEAPAPEPAPEPETVVEAPVPIPVPIPESEPEPVVAESATPPTPKVSVPPPVGQDLSGTDTDTHTFEVPEAGIDREMSVDELKDLGREVFSNGESECEAKVHDEPEFESESSETVAWESRAPNGISINRAGVEQFCLLPSVGPATAQLIIDHRLKNGPFSSLKDLLKVPGLGQKTYRDMTGVGARSDLKKAELRLNQVLGVDSDVVSLAKVAEAAIKKFQLKGCFVGDVEGNLIAQASSDDLTGAFGEPFLAVAPQLYKRSRKALTQACLPESEMVCFYLGKFAVTFAGSGTVYCVMVHGADYPNAKVLKSCRKFISELVWYCSNRAVM